MKKQIKKELQACWQLDWAVLYLRLFTGAAILLHNIGKIQIYNEIINSYTSFWGLSNATTFIIITIGEVVLAVMLIIGFWVRLSSLLLILGLFISWFWHAGECAGEEIIWLGMLIFFLVSGAGRYSFDAANRYAPQTKQ